ncbi:hypothetical protein [Peloplasma aerotolerans]|uniref:ATP-binding protein n=1 Tax=Peloplasma aerotolerans TaxID=3044389 RepID=A0AAW6U6U1_9MOLU|nr:hypothetical protein [Mariniplasma sp. M4Ah]MDI6453683.1 hypothetical protein [Mariniplasma sp. M4Ah]
MELNRIQVKNAYRKTRRDIRKVFSDNFLKIITEVVLNADDSYKRIESISLNNPVREIVVKLNRDKREISVLDNAEGMTSSQMLRIFGEYGGDFSGGDNTNNVRGLFGQGAADVMFNAAMSKKKAQIESIKDGEVAKCKFYFEDNKEIDSKVIYPRMREYRIKTGIVENGTLVTFGLSDNVKIPKEKDLKDKIEQFYMFRYLLSNPLRKIVFYDGKQQYSLSSKKYLIQEEKIILKNKKIILEYDGRKLTSFLTLYEKDSQFESKIIIRDDNFVVYDETFFNMDNLPGANLISGELVIPNIATLLRELLNSEEPKELLTDSRDGFDGREEFTKGMNAKVGKILEQEIEKNNSRRDVISVNLNNNKRFNDIMKKINNYYSELELSSIEGLNPGANPPNYGIKFARPTISITKGKTYDLKIYINASQISTSDIILISHKGSTFFTTDNSEITYKKEDIKDNNLVVKSVVIRSTKTTEEPIVLIAKCKEYSAQVLVSVIDEKIIYPKKGLEFLPKRKNIKPESKTDFKLYFDTDLIPIGSSIKIEKTYEMELIPESEILKISEEYLLTENIGAIKIKVQSGLYEERIQITAHYNDISASAILYVRISDRADEGNSGFLNKIELRFEDDFWQTSMMESKGILYINGKHIINRNIMGDLGQSDKNNPTFKKEQRKYLYELISIESAKRIIRELHNRGQLHVNNPESIYDQIQEHKTMIYMEIAEIG